MNITLKNVPEGVYRVIKRRAREQGRSLNSQILAALEAEAAKIERRRRLRDVHTELRKFRASLPPMENSAPLIWRDRRR